MMKKGRFHFKKWKSNDPSIFRNLSHDSHENELLHLDDNNCSVLRVEWSSKLDVFKFTIVPSEIKASYTKRELLSQIA